MITIKQPAKWCSHCGHIEDLQQPAIVEINGVKLFSETPTTAKHAETINQTINRLVSAPKDPS